MHAAPTPPLTRYYKSSPADFMTWLDSTPAGYTQSEVWSGSSSTPMLGYQRFGNNLTDSTTNAAGRFVARR